MESKVSQYLWKQLRGADSDCPELLRRLSEKRTRKMERGGPEEAREKLDLKYVPEVVIIKQEKCWRLFFVLDFNPGGAAGGQGLEQRGINQSTQGQNR